MNSPFWVNHLVYCEHATVRGLKVESHFPNNDGVDVDSSRYVRCRSGQARPPRPTQLLDDDGDDRLDRLVFLADLDEVATHSYLINDREAGLALSPRTHAEVSIKEGGEWQRETYVGGTFKKSVR